MIEEAVGMAWRVVCTVAQAVLELPFELGLKIPGLIIQKILWPPYWFGKVEEGPVTYLAGVAFYVVAAVLLVVYCCDG